VGHVGVSRLYGQLGCKVKALTKLQPSKSMTSVSVNSPTETGLDRNGALLQVEVVIAVLVLMKEVKCGY